MNALPAGPNWNHAREDTSSSDLTVLPTRGVPSVSFQRASVSRVSDSSDAGRSPAVNTASGMAPATNGASVATWATTAWYGFLAMNEASESSSIATSSRLQSPVTG